MTIIQKYFAFFIKITGQSFSEKKPDQMLTQEKITGAPCHFFKKIYDLTVETNPSTFLKTASMPILRGARAKKKTGFFSQNLPKI